MPEKAKLPRLAEAFNYAALKQINKELEEQVKNVNELNQDLTSQFVQLRQELVWQKRIIGNLATALGRGTD